jgi:hypothetical protein
MVLLNQQSSFFSKHDHPEFFLALYYVIVCKTLLPRGRQLCAESAACWLYGSHVLSTMVRRWCIATVHTLTPLDVSTLRDSNSTGTIINKYILKQTSNPVRFSSNTQCLLYVSPTYAVCWVLFRQLWRGRKAASGETVPIVKVAPWKELTEVIPVCFMASTTVWWPPRNTQQSVSFHSWMKWSFPILLARASCAWFLSFSVRASE